MPSPPRSTSCHFNWQTSPLGRPWRDKERAPPSQFRRLTGSQWRSVAVKREEEPSLAPVNARRRLLCYLGRDGGNTLSRNTMTTTESMCSRWKHTWPQPM